MLGCEHTNRQLWCGNSHNVQIPVLWRIRMGAIAINAASSLVKTSTSEYRKRPYRHECLQPESVLASFARECTCISMSGVLATSWSLWGIAPRWSCSAGWLITCCSWLTLVFCRMSWTRQQASVEYAMTFFRYCLHPTVATRSPAGDEPRDAHNLSGSFTQCVNNW